MKWWCECWCSCWVYWTQSQSTVCHPFCAVCLTGTTDRTQWTRRATASIDVATRSKGETWLTALCYSAVISVCLCVSEWSYFTNYVSDLTLLLDGFFTAHSKLRKVLVVLRCLWLVCLFEYEISTEPLNGFAPNLHGRRIWSLGQTNLNVNVKCQGHQGQICSPLKCIVMHLLQMTSCSSRWDHSVAVGGDGSAQRGQSVIYVASCVRFVW